MSTATAQKPAQASNKPAETKADAKVENKTPAPENKETKVTTAEAAKPTEKATEEFNEALYQELLVKFQKFLLSDEEETAFNKLRAQKKQSLTARLTAIQQAVSLISQHKIELSELVDLNAYSQEIVKMEAESYYPSFARSKKAPANAGEKQTRVAKDHGMKVFEIKKAGAKGKPTTIAVNSPFPADSLPFGANYQHVKDMSGNALNNLKSFAIKSPEVEEFLKSEDGHQFATKWAGWISRGGKKA